MKASTVIKLIITHAIVAFIGFSIGIYTLPILTAPPAPSAQQISALSGQEIYTAKFERDLQDSDTLHWGEGKVSIGKSNISLIGELAPGPNYKLYLSKTFVETEADFKALKSTMVQVGDIKTFDNFIVDVPLHIDPTDYNSVIVWCESFNEFITAAKYQ